MNFARQVSKNLSWSLLAEFFLFHLKTPLNLIPVSIELMK